MKKGKKTIRILLSMLILGIVFCLASCEDNTSPDVVCTTEFVTANLLVVDQNNQPVSDVAITVLNGLTGSPYAIDASELYNPQPGSYTIFHDGFKDDLLPGGQPVEVRGEKDGHTFKADYLFGADECHIRKLEGPDVVTIDISSNPENRTFDPITMVDEVDPNDWPNDPLEVLAATINGDTLRIEVSYSGGCVTHDFKFLVGRSFMESYPVRTFTFLSHEDNDDECDNLITEELTFDLTPLKTTYQEAYQTETGTVIMLLRNNDPATELHYTF